MGVRAVSQCDVDICYGCVSKLLVCRHLALTCAWGFWFWLSGSRCCLFRERRLEVGVLWACGEEARSL